MEYLSYVKLALSAVFIFFGVIAVGIGILKSRKYTYVYALSRLITAIFAALFSMVISAVLAGFAAIPITSALSGLLPSEANDAILAIPSGEAAVRTIIAMLIAPGFFFVLFLILKPVFAKIFALPLARLISIVLPNQKPDAPDNSAELSGKEKKLAKKQAFFCRKFTLPGILVGAVSGLIVFVILAVPVFGAMNTFAIVDPELKDINAGNNEYGNYIETVATVSDALKNNVGSVTVKVTGGTLLYRGITTQIMDGKIVSLGRELKFISSAVSAGAAVFDNDLAYSVRAEKIKALPKSFEKTVIMPVIISETANEAVKKFSRARIFSAFRCPTSVKPSTVCITSLMRYSGTKMRMISKRISEPSRILPR